MNALYFRDLFQNVKRGFAHTVSVSTQEGTFCLCSLCSDGQPLCDETEAVEKFRMKGQDISILVLESLHPDDLKRAADLLKDNRVARVWLPYGDSAAALPELSLASEVKLLRAGEVISLQENGWKVWTKCLENGSKGTIVLHHGPAETKKDGRDCLMAVKPTEKDLPCCVCVDQEDHACGMRCCLYNDFSICKGHNGKEMDSYVAGTLLLGNADLKRKEKELKEDLGEYLKDIRLAALGEAGNDEKTSETFLKLLGSENIHLNQYYILSAGMENESTLKAILKQGPRRIPVMTNEESGLCVSGFFK